MSHRKIVVALGGNAILSTDPSAQAQEAALAETARHLVKLIQNGDELIITHGNGPQVGNLLLQHLAANSEKNPTLRQPRPASSLKLASVFSLSALASSSE